MSQEKTQKNEKLIEICKKVFNTYDTNNSGLFEPKELFQYFKDRMDENMVDINSFDYEAILRDCDTDGDGRISFEEFMEHLSCYYS